VGNIPYGATEEQLVEIFQEVGPVVSFRLVLDRDTGRSKGYGFCEYRDAAMALSAMRNLNGYEMNGRALRVDFAERGLEDKDSVPLITPPVPVAPPGVQSEVLKIIEGMSHPQLQEILIQMKNLIQKNSDHVRHLLINNPQFSFALLQSQVILGVVTSETAKQALSPPTTVKQPPLEETLSNVIGSPSQRHLAPHNIPMALPSHVSASFPPFNPLPLGSLGPLTRPGGFDFEYAPPPPMGYPIAPENLGEILPEDQRLLLEQVLQLSPEQIENLPPQERMQIMHLRQTVMQLNYLGPR
jgi:cleavage stimulation factor subunit 2